MFSLSCTEKLPRISMTKELYVQLVYDERKPTNFVSAKYYTNQKSLVI